MGIKFGGWAPNHHCKNIGRFEFGSSVRDRHTYICKYEILVDFNLAVARQTAKLPNFPAIQYVSDIHTNLQGISSLRLF